GVTAWSAGPDTQADGQTLWHFPAMQNSPKRFQMPCEDCHRHNRRVNIFRSLSSLLKRACKDSFFQQNALSCSRAFNQCGDTHTHTHTHTQTHTNTETL